MTAAPAEKVNFVTRTMREGDRPFLFSSFLKSFRESDQSEGIASAQFFLVFKAQFEMVLNAFSVLVAHPEADDDEIAGWIAYSRNVVAWLYVKKIPWRHCGVARHLMTAAHIGTNVRALYGSRWALALAKSKGLRVEPVSFVEGARLLLGRAGA